MPTKKELLKNLSSYSPEEIAIAVSSGVVTLYELGHDAGGAFTPLLRMKVKQLLENPSTLSAGGQAASGGGIQGGGSQQSIGANHITADGYSGGNGPAYNGTARASQSTHKRMFSAPFSFYGRIGRAEFAISYIIYLLWVGASVFVVMQHYSRERLFIIGIIWCVTMLIMYWLMWAQGAKRCHDRGNSGLFQLIPFYFIWMLFAPGDEDANDYGASPK